MPPPLPPLPMPRLGYQDSPDDFWRSISDRPRAGYVSSIRDGPTGVFVMLMPPMQLVELDVLSGVDDKTVKVYAPAIDLSSDLYLVNRMMTPTHSHGWTLQLIHPQLVSCLQTGVVVVVGGGLRCCSSYTLKRIDRWHGDTLESNPHSFSRERECTACARACASANMNRPQDAVCMRQGMSSE